MAKMNLSKLISKGNEQMVEIDGLTAVFFSLSYNQTWVDKA